MAIVSVSGPAGFQSPPTELFWDRITSSDSPLNDKEPVRNEPRYYAANGAPVLVNVTGTSAQFRVNGGGGSVDVNLEDGAATIKADYASGSKKPGDTPIVLNFLAPLRGVGAYVSIIGDKTLYDGRGLHAVMWVTLGDGQPASCVSGDGITGRRLKKGTVPTTAFVGAESDGNALITRVAFDASLNGNFGGLVISDLYWTA